MFIEVTLYDTYSETITGKILVNINNIAKISTFDYKGSTLMFFNDGHTITVLEKYEEIKDKIQNALEKK